MLDNVKYLRSRSDLLLKDLPVIIKTLFFFIYNILNIVPIKLIEEG